MAGATRAALAAAACDAEELLPWALSCGRLDLLPDDAVDALRSRTQSGSASFVPARPPSARPPAARPPSGLRRSVRNVVANPEPTSAPPPPTAAPSKEAGAEAPRARLPLQSVVAAERVVCGAATELAVREAAQVLLLHPVHTISAHLARGRPAMRRGNLAPISPHFCRGLRRTPRR